MDTAAQISGLSNDGIPDPIADPTAEHMALLGELAEIGMVVARALGRQVQATGHAGPAEAAMLDEVGRAVRRTVALRQKLYEDSRRSDEQRHAEQLQRIAAAARARFRARKETVLRAVAAEIHADAERRGVPGDAERLLNDLRERVVDAAIERADTPEAVSALILGLCKDLEITPRRATWSDALMAEGIRATRQELDDVLAAFVPPAVDAAPVPAPVTVPVGPGEYRKLGRFTFAPSGAVVAADPPEPGWSEHDLGWQAPPDPLKGRGPPDTG